MGIYYSLHEMVFFSSSSSSSSSSSPPPPPPPPPSSSCSSCSSSSSSSASQPCFGFALITKFTKAKRGLWNERLTSDFWHLQIFLDVCSWQI